LLAFGIGGVGIDMDVWPLLKFEKELAGVELVCNNGSGARERSSCGVGGSFLSKCMSDILLLYMQPILWSLLCALAAGGCCCRCGLYFILLYIPACFSAAA
jgi:hypothetical protein